MIEYRTITQIAGPLVFVEKTHKIGYGELVEIEMQDGKKKAGQVIDTSDNIVVIQVFEGTSNIDRKSIVRFSGKTIRLNCNPDMLGRVLDSMGKPLDGGADIVPEKQLDVNGLAMNPYSRDVPSRFLQTGISSIDGMNTLTVGQKLPIFSISGLPHNEIALQVARQAKISKNTAVVFAAIGITNEEARQFIEEFEKTGALERSVIFLNLANDPAIERLITPRSALTAAEYLAFEKGYDVLVILTDMTSYAEALREIGAAREEVPGRRGYPGYMYTDLANIFERAGIIKGKKGSITQFSIITMPSGDITHPVPDLTGYITEGQIVLSKELHSKGIYPPIDVLPSLSRLMQKGASKENTRDDHRAVSNQMYAAYAEGRSLRSLAAIVGKEALTERDRLYLKFADEFENNFVRQGKYDDRDIQQSLNLGWKLLTTLPRNELTKIDDSLIKTYEEKLGLKFAELGGS